MKLIVVSAVWCPSCLILNKQLKKIKDDYPELEIIKYDYDFDDEVEKYEVGEKLPVMIVLDDDGNEIRRMVGEKKDEEIREFINQ